MGCGMASTGKWWWLGSWQASGWSRRTPTPIQKWLKGKTVKKSQSRHVVYKEPLSCTIDHHPNYKSITATTITTRVIISQHKQHITTLHKQGLERKEWKSRVAELRKIKKARKKNEEREWQACTNRLISSLPLKAYPLLRIRDFFFFWGISHSGPFS